MNLWTYYGIMKLSIILLTYSEVRTDMGGQTKHGL